MHLLRKRIPFACFLAGVWLGACGAFEGRGSSPAAVFEGSTGAPAALLNEGGVRLRRFLKEGEFACGAFDWRGDLLGALGRIIYT